MFVVAVLAPSGLYAAANFSNVALVDAYSGASAQIDGSRRLRTYDQSAGYASNPLFAVNISTHSLSVTYQNIYTIPVGKVLIIKSITCDYSNYTSGPPSIQFNAGSDDSVVQVYSMDGDGAQRVLLSHLDHGLIIRAGNLYLSNTGTDGTQIYTYIQGYLVPDSAVPSPSSAEAAQQFVSSAHLAGVTQRH